MGRPTACLLVLALGACAKIVGIKDYDPHDAADIDAAFLDAPNEIDAPFGMFPAYLKASNTGANDTFGSAIAVSADGLTVVVGAPAEDSNAIGVNKDETNNAATDAGAAYVFVRMGTTWMQQAYLKASNTGGGDRFGTTVAISADGSTIAVGASGEDGAAVGINGADSNGAGSAGAVYVFARTGGTWTQQAYIKASNTGSGDEFGGAVALSGDGNTLAVGAANEDSAAVGVNGDQGNADPTNVGSDFGAVYVYVRASGVWVQQAYVKASNTGNGDAFGSAVALAMDGDTLAVSAPNEDSNATGINGNQSANTAPGAGAAYVFKRVSGIWAQQAYIKASNTGAGDLFGASISLAADGNTLAVGAPQEDSNATGINGVGTSNTAGNSGAVYTFLQVAATWTTDAYIKASNTAANDQFGFAVALSGQTLAVGAYLEDSNADGTGGDQADNAATDAGAVYVFAHATTWSQTLYSKATNSDATDRFGQAVGVAGPMFVTGAPQEDSNATGIGGDQLNALAANSGAVYVLQ